MEIEFGNQRLKATPYRNKAHLTDLDPELCERVGDSVFKQCDPMWAAAAENSPGTVIYGDVNLDEDGLSPVYETLDAPGRFLIFTGSVTAGGLGLEATDRVVILGDLHTNGVSNRRGELWVEGTTHIRGALFFDSYDRGFTRLRLASPVGFLAATSTVFDISPLAARYYFDPLFRCGFKNAPNTRHEEIMHHMFANTPRQVSADELAKFFRSANDYSVAELVRAGAHEEWLHTTISAKDSTAFARFFDETLRGS